MSGVSQFEFELADPSWHANRASSGRPIQATAVISVAVTAQPPPSGLPEVAGIVFHAAGVEHLLDVAVGDRPGMLDVVVRNEWMTYLARLWTEVYGAPEEE